ncbi:MAG: flavodoxin [Methanobacteriaceae archaeon]|jgi:flavodoxin|nr:flavodoxin [Candidatus Methanorudis spinitermitis]
MKTLIVYYSRTKITANVAKILKKKFGSDIEEIKDVKNRSGRIGWIKSCLDAIRGVSSEIKPIEKDPSEYDTVIIGTPVWASTMASPILTYITENKEKFNDIAFFCTCGHGGYEETLAKMEKISAKKPLETLFLTKSDINAYDDKLGSYTNKIKSRLE